MQFLRRAACVAVFLGLMAPSLASAAAETSAKGTAFPAMKRRIEQNHVALEQQKQQSQKHEQEDNETNDDDDGDDDDDDQQKPAPSTPVSQGAEDVKSPEIPAPASVGASGFPELPAVSKMLDTASASLRSVQEEAKRLESEAVQTQSQNEARLAKQKAIFERKLQAQEEQNRGVIAANAQISAEIAVVTKGNADLKKHSLDMVKKNRLMRKELQIMSTRLGAARSFITSSLTETDDTDAEELNVLHLRSKHHRARHANALLDTEGHDLDDTDGDTDDDTVAVGEAFISLGSRARRSVQTVSDQVYAEAGDLEDASMGAADGKLEARSPNEMVSVLSQRVEDLRKEGKQSATKLRALFVGAFKNGAKRHSALMEQQRSLNATRQSLIATKDKLMTAVQRVDGTGQELEQRLRGIGFYLQKLAHVALAPPSEASTLLREVPSKIAPAPQPTKNKP